MFFHLKEINNIEKHFMNKIPEIVKKQIDDMFEGISSVTVDLPGFTYDGILYHKNGKPLFTVSRNVFNAIDVQILPSYSNLLHLGFEHSKAIQDYVKSKIEKMGIRYDKIYILPFWREKDFLEYFKLDYL